MPECVLQQPYSIRHGRNDQNCNYPDYAHGYHGIFKAVLFHGFVIVFHTVNFMFYILILFSQAPNPSAH